ncbi:translation initiation factor IF-2-like [Eriocheir sinensis]|uniref:translation initiation factor IF-2-like n=1 Tax=Eriocheir sinensis TaxID=95602 RepID=UPI0021C9999F|nr:translation initiation factor IF-2-like [Eriocheir sinensis]
MSNDKTGAVSSWPCAHHTMNAGHRMSRMAACPCPAAPPATARGPTAATQPRGTARLGIPPAGVAGCCPGLGAGAHVVRGRDGVPRQLAPHYAAPRRPAPRGTTTHPAGPRNLQAEASRRTHPVNPREARLAAAAAMRDGGWRRRPGWPPLPAPAWLPPLPAAADGDAPGALPLQCGPRCRSGAGQGRAGASRPSRPAPPRRQLRRGPPRPPWTISSVFSPCWAPLAAPCPAPHTPRPSPLPP